jgi:hypothetical protein
MSRFSAFLIVALRQVDRDGHPQVDCTRQWGGGSQRHSAFDSSYAQEAGFAKSLDRLKPVRTSMIEMLRSAC